MLSRTMKSLRSLLLANQSVHWPQFHGADKRHETLESKTKQILLLKAIAVARE